MKIALFGIVAIVALVLLAALAARRKPGTGLALRAYRRRDFLSRAERSFFGALQQAVEREGLIFAKVRLADLLMPAAGEGSGGWQGAFNRIQAKHVDFVLCSLGDVVPKLAIELDDASHRQAKRRERDEFLNAACQSAGLPLLRIPAHRDHAVQQLREQIAPYLGLVLDRHPTLELPAVESVAAPPASAAEPEPAPLPSPPPIETAAAPSCPKCSAPMVRREGKSGVLAGKAFWGCSTFPRCRGLA